MFRYIKVIIVLMIFVFLIQAQERGDNRADLIPDLMTEINLWRLNSGLEPLVYNATLEQLAIAQADYLVSFSEIPSAIHTGRDGESPRQRSQYEQFSWPTYGHPELFAVTEIAAIGSIESAMDFWQNSDIHTRSALNPTYREVGVAVRQLNNGVLFIVVLGGQPNVLPALPDPDTNELYLTTERNDWQGDWISVVTEYRLLDSTLEPFTNWLEWEYRIDLPDIPDDFFYIEYQDGENRVRTRVPLEPVWTLSGEELALALAIDEANNEDVEADTEDLDEAIASLPTSTPTDLPTLTPTPVAFATSTPLPTVTPLPSPTLVIPTLTPRPSSNVQLVYNEDYLTLINNSAVIADLYGMTLSNGNFTYDVLTWEVPADEINIGALPSNHCLQLGGFNTSNSINFLEQCSFIRSFVTISEDNFFWVDGTFEILIEDQVIATCTADAGVCDIDLD